ncbi:N-acetylmuramic acid 6-phosphate etherase [Evansella vedderi]|uniref:N-acetylmuramic acid 6-phosphate etherase n=1 Tax=Evansella vedderi TaxID=38282 RepID=A0ABT9ZZH5_9BACI|nr:N-acetylmuramic acid 6-phosphate etherase [Evansella vedderi]MDQ0256642.1 N-acetylmuramic acid 6-phosphate etherase [Evansella vedderi]
MELNLSTLITEQRNEATKHIDQMSTGEILSVMNKEDQTVAIAVKRALPQIERSVDIIFETLKNNGRLFYVGAGTSGRLGVLDASECPPTFRTPPEMVQALIAGGEKAIFTAVEGAEDDPVKGATDLKKAGFKQEDVVVGIAASGRTPYVIGALKYARTLGAKTIGLSCNKESELSQVSHEAIEVVVGPEVLTGSTRLKAATAHKMVLNMLTTATMIKFGKVYENLMVDVNASNYKLKERAKRIVTTVTGVTAEEAEKVLYTANHDVKYAIVMIKAGVSLREAKKLLEKHDGFVRQAIEEALK